jgi:hypothetical protein
MPVACPAPDARPAEETASSEDTGRTTSPGEEPVRGPAYWDNLPLRADASPLDRWLDLNA